MTKIGAGPDTGGAGGGSVPGVEALRVTDPVSIGDYAVLGRLGHGAMGTVYLGRSLGGRPVAVKVARPELAEDPGFRDRFRREVAMARAVGGFWTATVVDADPDGPLPWLATEYVPGPTLRDAVTAHGPLPEPAVHRLVAGLAEALRAIHATGMVHRDLKPSNVLLAADGPRVIDFGIAKALPEPGLTATGVLVGTPGFLPPEQIHGGQVTPAGDVFALGAVLVYAATGHGPFGSGEPAALMYRTVHASPDLAGVPAGLRALATRCLHARPEQRPSPADVLAEVGEPGTAEWLPAPVRASVEERRTEVVVVASAPRPPTRPYTVAGSPPPVAASGPGWAAGTGSPGTGSPGSRTPGGVPGAAGPAGAVNSAVFATSRLSALALGVPSAIGALVCASVSGAASRQGNGGAAFLLFVGFVLAGITAVRLGWRLVRPFRVEVSGAGLTVGHGTRSLHLGWHRIARARVVEHRRRPWLVVWPNSADAAGACRAAGYRDAHGGFRMFPVGHERRRAARVREVRELRAALGWYGRTTHDAGY
ncbi:MAG TPA: protein kinase [Mycobacteriales bacterium]|nr:protein kinase [Mycobacteriales bacterium]